MKQNDVALIVVLVVVSGVVSFIVSGFIFKSSAGQGKSVETVTAINSNFNVSQTAPQYINSNSIDPTQLIQIQAANNPNPFAGQ